MIDHHKTATAVSDLLLALGVDEGEQTADTPNRVARYWSEALAGYDSDPRQHLERTFPATGDTGPVIMTGIRLNSTCAHHLLPITGSATVAYRPNPNDRVVGLSKLTRVLHGYARRLQVQERIGAQVADALMDVLTPEGAACVITAEHGCMSVRGVGEHQAVTTTHAWGGAWASLDHPERACVLAAHGRGL